MSRPIAIGLSPNTQSMDAKLALRVLVQPFIYTKGIASTALENWFEKYFAMDYAVGFTSGRGALYAVLKGFGVGNGDEVICQAFTCLAVVQAIRSTGAKPVYVDIGSDFTISLESLETAITKKTKVILVQHTFNIASNLKGIKKIADKQNIRIVEDVAHGIGGVYEEKKLGTVGDAGIFSFGRDKAFSCVSGGMAVTSDPTLGQFLKKFHKHKEYPTMWWILQQILHTVVFYYLILPSYTTVGIGKLVLVILQKTHILSFPVNAKREEIDGSEIKKMPQALAKLALLQLTRVEKTNKRRQKICMLYQKELGELFLIQFSSTNPLLRFPLLVDDPKNLLKYLRKKQVYIGDWYSHIIDPKGVDLKKIGYKLKSCPNAELIASRIVNLPTYYSMSDKQIQSLVSHIKKYATRKK